ncbi:MAG: hypothetical protein ACD_58C00149G0001 [uncultured bacterium]|nr:MAG: hypothetical protein ACD_58C00149G0001 [uncultured bacterium]
MNFQQFLKPSYYFNPQPSYTQNEIWFYLIFFAVILIGSIVLKIIYKKKSLVKQLYNFFDNQFFASFLTCAIIGFVLLFFRWQYIIYLSTRILIIIDFLITLIYLILFIIYLLKKLPHKLEKFEKDLHYRKYIPKPRK